MHRGVQWIGTQSSRPTATVAARSTSTGRTSRARSTTSSTGGGRRSTTPTATSRATTPRATGTATGACRARGRRRRRRGHLPEHDPAVLPAGVAGAPAAGRDRRRSRAALGGPARAQPVARRLLRCGAGSSRRHRPDPAARRRRRGRRDPVGGRGRAHRRGVAPRHAARARGSPPLYAPDYEPLWAVCEELGMPMNHHTGSGSPDYGDYPEAQGDVPRRGDLVRAPHALAPHLRRRHGAPPDLQFVFTEQGTAWVPEHAHDARLLQGPHAGQAGAGGSQEHIFGAELMGRLSLEPSEYWARQCHVGSSFIRRDEVEMRHAVGVDRIMWGSDFPHREGLLALQPRAPAARVRRCAIRTRSRRWSAATRPRVYGFDLDALAPVAARIGPIGRRGRRTAAGGRHPRRRAALPGVRARLDDGPRIRRSAMTRVRYGARTEGRARGPGGLGDVGRRVVDVAHRDLRDRPRRRRRGAAAAARTDRRSARAGVGRERRPRPGHAAVRRRHVRGAGAPRGHRRQLPARDADDHRAVGGRRSGDVRRAEEARRGRRSSATATDPWAARSSAGSHASARRSSRSTAPSARRSTVDRRRAHRLLLQVPPRPTARASTADPCARLLPPRGDDRGRLFDVDGELILRESRFDPVADLPVRRIVAHDARPSASSMQRGEIVQSGAGRVAAARSSISATTTCRPSGRRVMQSLRRDASPSSRVAPAASAGRWGSGSRREGMQVVLADVERRAAGHDGRRVPRRRPRRHRRASPTSPTTRRSSAPRRDARRVRRASTSLCNNAGVGAGARRADVGARAQRLAVGDRRERVGRDPRHQGVRSVAARPGRRGPRGQHVVGQRRSVTAAEHAAVYASTKAAVVTITECLYGQLQRSAAAGSARRCCSPARTCCAPGCSRRGATDRPSSPNANPRVDAAHDDRVVREAHGRRRASTSRTRRSRRSRIGSCAASLPTSSGSCPQSDRADAQITARAASMLARTNPVYLRELG